MISDELSATVSNIQRYSIHDGPGIRTTVFMKGCAMNCLWCHNPECLDDDDNLRYISAKCIKCGMCVKACASGALSFSGDVLQYDRARCVKCYSCADACCSMALVRTGGLYTVRSLFKEIIADKPFYQTSGGGVTFSGGEPLLQSRFLSMLIPHCRSNGIHVAIETAGYVNWSNFQDISGMVDLFLYDIKTVDDKKHMKYTGASNRLILENLEKLEKEENHIVIRIPIIPGFNDDAESMRGILEHIRGFGVKPEIEMLGYHRLAEGKYRSLWREYHDFPELAEGRLEELSAVFSGEGYHVKLHRH